MINNAINDGEIGTSLLSTNLKYIEQIIDKKICIFSEEGSIIKNYLEFASLYPRCNINNLVEKIKASYRLDDVDVNEEKKYINDYINKNKIVTNEEEFDEILNHLQLVKLKDNNFSLPIEYVNFIIKQALENDSVISKNPEKYLNLVECCIEDLGRNDLSKDIKPPYHYFTTDYVKSNTFESGQSGGLHDSYRRLIQIPRKNIMRMIKEKNLDILNSIFHENAHAEQYYDFLNFQINSYNRYIMKKEDVLRKYFSDFYKDNYSLTYIEIEANEKAAQKLANYIDSLDISDISNLNFLDSFGKEISDACKDVIEQKTKEYKEGEKKIIEGKTQDVVEVFDELIKENPYFFDTNPEFLIEYNKDGSKKSLRQILNNAEAYINEEKNLYDIITRIIKNGNIITADSIIDDMEVLMNAEQKKASEETMIETIISENIGKVIFDIIINDDEMDYNQLILYKQMIEEIDSRMRL